MPRYEITMPPSFPETDAGRIHTWLAALGYVVAGVAVRPAKVGPPATDPVVVVEADRDPTGDLASYIIIPTQEETNLSESITVLRQARDAILLKDPASRTPQEKITLALITVLRDLARALR